MSVNAVTTFVALLSLLCLAFVVMTAVLAAVSRGRGGLPPLLDDLRQGFVDLAIPMAFAVALASTLGSLYMSEVAKFDPCELCWYQRICMYPLTVLLGVAWVRGRDLGVRWYVWPLTLIGFGFSVFHYLVERFPTTVTYTCNDEVPCSFVWVWKFHFLSLPAMAGIGFVTIGTLLAIAAADGRRTAESPSDAESPSPTPIEEPLP